MNVLRDGALIVVETYKAARVYGWRAGKLKPLGVYRHQQLYFQAESEGQVILRQGKSPPYLTAPSQTDPREHFLAITSLDEVLDAQIPNKAGSKKAGSKKAGS